MKLGLSDFFIALSDIDRPNYMKIGFEMIGYVIFIDYRHALIRIPALQMT
jgi:hypothetical protein